MRRPSTLIGHGNARRFTATVSCSCWRSTRLGEIASRRADTGAAEDVLGRAAAVAEELGDVHGRAGEARRLMGMARLFGGDEAGRVGADRGRPGRLPGCRGPPRRGLGRAEPRWIRFSRGDIDVAEAHLTDAAVAFGQLGDRGGSAWADGLLAFVRFHQGRFDEARELAERVLKESARRGDNWGQGMMLVVSAWFDLWKGRTAGGPTDADRPSSSSAPSVTWWASNRPWSPRMSTRMLGDIEEGRALMVEAKRRPALRAGAGRDRQGRCARRAGSRGDDR